MKRLIALGFISILLTGCSTSSFEGLNRNSIKFTMPNRNINNIHEPDQQANNEQKRYTRVAYAPMTQAECLKSKDKLGLKYCPYDNDHLAGVAKACGHLNNVPTGENLRKLAQKIYNTRTSDTSIYGDRNDNMLKEMGLYAEDSHLFFWTGEEYKDGKQGFVRMFASKGSIPYFASRDGKGYVSEQLGNINYGETRYIRTNPEHDSNLVGLPNNDVLFAVCYK